MKRVPMPPDILKRVEELQARCSAGREAYLLLPDKSKEQARQKVIKERSAGKITYLYEAAPRLGIGK